MMQQQNNNNTETRSSFGGKDVNSLKLRIDVTPLVQQLEMDIRGLREVWDDKQKSIMVIRVAEPLFKNVDGSVNDKGCHMFLAFIRSIMNTHVVQGNLKEDDFSMTLYRIRRRLSSDLIINRINWGLSIQYYNYAIDITMNLIENFMTRLIGNKERDGLNDIVKVVESSSTVAQNKGFLNI